MNNLPEGILSWDLDAAIHEAECDDQPEGFPCICDHIADRRREEEAENQMEMERGN